MTTISRNEYVGLYGPTAGDRVRLGDTGLFVQIERDLRGAPVTRSSSAAARACAKVWGWTIS